VRREKTLSSSGWKARPAIGSLQPEAIEAAVEATKLSEPSMERIVKRFREHAGRNVSERWAGLEKPDAEADPPRNRGRPPSWGTRLLALSAGGASDRNPRFRRGTGDGTWARNPTETREAPAVAAR